MEQLVEEKDHINYKIEQARQKNDKIISKLRKNFERIEEERSNIN